MLSKDAKMNSKFATSNGASEKDASFPVGSHDPAYVYEVESGGKWHEARIIAASLRQQNESSSARAHDYVPVYWPTSYRYYIHYLDYNRRMDEWIDEPNRIRKLEKTLERYNQEKKDKQDKGDIPHDSSDDENLTPQKKKAHEEMTKFKTVHHIIFGKYRAPTWYFSPLPERYHGIDTLYFCEYCLSFFVEEEEQERHMMICTLVSPPGDMIYLDDENRAIWEVDSVKNPIYIENLGYLAKMFLDHKLLEYMLNVFMFYVLTEVDETGHHFVGYFSKNREWNNNYNLSCILVLPFFQKKGYGKFLINFSYELASIEGLIGTPERPLSDFGRQAYLSFWLQRLIDYIRTLKEDQLNNLTISQLSKATFVLETDIIFALDKVKILKRVGDTIYLCLKKSLLDDIYRECGSPAPAIDRTRLHWIPYRKNYELDKIKA